DDQPNVRLQFALTVSAVGLPQTDDVMAKLLTLDSHSIYVRDAVISGLRARELEFIDRLVKQSEWSKPQAGRAELLASLGRCIMNEASPKRVAQLLDLVGTTSQQWQENALVNGMNEVAKVRFARKPMMLPSAPSQPVLSRAAQPPMSDLMARIAWPGEPGYVPPPPPKP